MRSNRKLLNQMDDQISPIWFVLAFHTVIHCLGVFVMLQLPDSWRLGTASRTVTVPAFSLVVWISALSFAWASLRLVTFRPVRVQVLILMMIPMLMSAGTVVYAHLVTKCTATVRAEPEAELELLNARIDLSKDNPHHLWWNLQERDRLLDILQ